MFLEQTLKRNPQLIETAVALHQSGQLAPDTYVLDVDFRNIPKVNKNNQFSFYIYNVEKKPQQICG